MKTWQKGICLMVLSVLILFGGSACSNESNESGTNTSTSNESNETSDNSLKMIKSNGEITIGTEGTYAPFTFHDQNGELTGFDVEIAEEIAKRLGVRAKFVETKWDGMLAGLDAKRFDMVANEVTIRDDRKVKYEFSEPYILSKAVLIVNQNNTSIKSLVDLKGRKSGQSLTSNLGDIAKANGAQLISVDGFNQAIDLLTSGRIDATINDKLSFLDLKKARPDVPIKVVAETDQVSQSGMLFRKGNKELIDAVNNAIKDMKADGKYLEISKTYFGEDVSK
ncbi:amino acid ABC transporter substrate-binding protein [Paenibacillus polysaccharolyticus]|uniref:amino acid ABC transporter substrate-binding protein n=1 Tax=Paenibacillus polysaccharolyticus TaxID=582692 RepID=UPI0020A01D0B|nr:amino acid ABC transporter substrate-binding protein [Paenibacillus polysaccharolyticus]MCP1136213.1 amino acid ABC transporter substrate-binding protein [Paenibacillus polysaccharolyticus]